jgi:hypothetical protein
MNLNDLFNEEKVRLDPKCWTGKKIGNPKTKMKGGVRVNNCVPAESVDQSVAEGLSDTIYPNAEVIKSKNGKPVGEIYQDGNSWGAFHYRADRGYDFIDSREEAIEALKDLHQETGRSRPDYTVKGVMEMDKSQTPPGRDGSNDPDAGKKEYTAKTITPKKVVKHAEKILNKELNKKQGVAEGSLNEFAPGNGGGESGRWYTDDQMTDIVGDGWWNDLDVSGDIPKQQMIQEAQAWLDDQGYNVQVLNCKVNDDDMEWYIEGSFQNSRFAKKGVAEGELDEKSTSQAQFRTMAAAAHNPKFAKKVGISRDVAKEFHGADRKQDYTDLPKKANEGKSAPKEKEADYGDDYQDMVARVKKLAGLGPLKTVYDPARRVYRNVPTAVQPKK